MELYEQFPCITNKEVVIRKMIEDNLNDLAEITNNDNIYKYIPPFLYKKSKSSLLTAIKNLGDRDFKKKKMIIAGIYLVNEPNKLVGLAEMFDYKKRSNTITIGYRINEKYWNKGIATNVVEAMINYLFSEIGIMCIKAFVMPENVYSSKVLLKNGFKKEEMIIQEKNWGGKDIVDLEVYSILNSKC